MKSFYQTIKEQPEATKKLCSCGIGVDRMGEPNVAAKLFSEATFRKAHGEELKQILPENISMASSSAMNPEERPFLLALLPCGLRNAFKDAFLAEFPGYADETSAEVMIEGNLNYEKVIYKYIDSLTSPEELPEIFITTDFNSLFHKSFLKKFLNSEYFEPLHVPVHPFWNKVGYMHPEGLLGMLTANLLVVIADPAKFEGGMLPTSWGDLLSPSLGKKLVLRGDADFFCNAVFYPIYKQFGKEGVSQLARNTLTGMHPSEMVKAINAGQTDDIAAIVMPYSFAAKIRNPRNFQMVWPVEGAIVSPVQMLVRKGAYKKYQKEIAFILSATMGEVLEKNGFPSVHAQTSKEYPSDSLNWLGWEYIYQNNLGSMKDLLQQTFFESYGGSRT